MVTMTLLVANAGDGRSLLVVTWLTKTSTCARPGSIWETAARATFASVFTPRWETAGRTTSSVNLLYSSRKPPVRCDLAVARLWSRLSGEYESTASVPSFAAAITCCWASAFVNWSGRNRNQKTRPAAIAEAASSAAGSTTRGRQRRPDGPGRPSGASPSGASISRTSPSGSSPSRTSTSGASTSGTSASATVSSRTASGCSLVLTGQTPHSTSSTGPRHGSRSHSSATAGGRLGRHWHWSPEKSRPPERQHCRHRSIQARRRSRHPW